MKKKLFLSLVASTLVALSSFSALDDPLDKLVANLAKFTEIAPHEKVHLQFDKPYYSLGEDIWFKAYLVTAQHNILTSQSKVLYIDLLDDRDSVKKTLLLPVVNGTASANIHLSDTLLSAGNYHIYAYTKWMLNFNSEFFFKKTIPVISAKHGAINASFRYNVLTIPAGKQLTTEINYKTDNNQPCANKPFSYTIQANGKNFSSGKGITDENGKAVIHDLIKSDFLASNIVIHAKLKPSDDASATENDFVIRPLSATADVQFFPEGGHLVKGVRTKVAFKALRPNGLGENITGYIADEVNEHVAEFSADHAGMGKFALQPLAGKTYTAFITHEDKSVSRFTLPNADDSGYVLNINRIGIDSLTVRIGASANLIDGRDVILIAQNNGVVQFAAKTKVDKASNVSLVSTKKFPTGITQFTLFSPDYTPVAERLIFVDHNDQLGAEITPDKTAYSKRDKVKLDMKVFNAFSEPVIGSFSVSVTDGNKVKSEEDSEITILSNLLLTSDIKGYVEQPNYYFNQANPNRLKHLDQLLLTQGWRRFSWKDLIANKLPVINYKPEQSLTVSGIITTLGDKPVSKGHVTLFGKTTNGPILIDTVADETGHFAFTDLEFSDSTKLIVRGSNAKNRTTIKIQIEKKTRIPYVTSDNGSGINQTGLAEYMKYSQERLDELTKFGLFNNAVALREVKIVSKKNYFAERIVPNSANLSPGSADQVIKGDKLDRQTNLLNVFYGLPGIEIKNNMVYRVGHLVSLLRPSGMPMMVLLDGVTIDPGMVKDIPPSDVAGVELLTSGSNTAIYGDQGYWGVIIITTKRGTGIGSISNSFNVAHYEPNGYAVVKQFYSPVYDKPNGQAKMADLRSTIYWNPDVITDADGKASITYFNADGAGTYKVTIEGMDTKGKLLRKTFTYTVK